MSTKELDALFAGLPETLSVAQAATVLGIGRATLYKWLDHGDVPAYKVASTWMIVRDELKATIEAGRNTPPPRDQHPDE
ncbi:Putative excisionase [Propionibacterium freudenreichii]|uniref:helix-turn-helix domain-containing protein n=1 Tax=Propionibacterium freudenreichii TaxID=1744 RepID=UPI0005423853|nr:helix-turn-helix domain-containing protein [Propionibacterium freudenreichii]CEG87472.1 Putative excisionase [Propionibacterium freudenreichii]CEI30279.1 Putative excisionase [Propionibacterium freudenreichii]